MVTPATGLQTLQHQAVISSMHRSYQPLKPATNRYLQQRWDQNNYENHRKKVGMKVEECRARVEVEVSCSLPAVDNKGLRTPAHIQLKLKKLQLQDERLAVIDRDNRLLASRLAHIGHSKGLVDHQNQYRLRSLNADRRREELLLVGHQNQGIYQRIVSRQSEYRRQLWLDKWERAERLRDNITRYPQGPVEKQRWSRKVKFAPAGGSKVPTSSRNSVTAETPQTDEDEEPPSSASSFSED